MSMSMKDLDWFKSKAINDAALRNGGKATIDYKDLSDRCKKLVSLTTKLIDVPIVKVVLDFHKIHFQYLLTVLAAMQNMKPADDAIAGMQSNLDEYVRQTEQLLGAVRDIPADPWDGMNKMGLIVLAPALKESAELARTYNDTLDAYEKLVQEALNATSRCAEQGRAIETDTRTKAAEMLAALDAVKTQGAIDVVLIEAARKKVQFIQLDLMTRIQNVRGSAEDAVKRLQPMLVQAASAQRIQ